jgi:hypothetical protein
VFLELSRSLLENKNFRMNERTFTHNLASLKKEPKSYEDEFGLGKKTKKV